MYFALFSSIKRLRGSLLQSPAPQPLFLACTGTPLVYTSFLCCPILATPFPSRQLLFAVAPIFDFSAKNQRRMPNHKHHVHRRVDEARSRGRADKRRRLSLAIRTKRRCRRSFPPPLSGYLSLHQLEDLAHSSALLHSICRGMFP